MPNNVYQFQPDQNRASRVDRANPGVSARSFWRNLENFTDVTPHLGHHGQPSLPLTSLRGPHSDLICWALDQHPDLKRFAVGVDERTVFGGTYLPCGWDYIDWDARNDGMPLVFAYHDEDNSRYEVACLEVHQVNAEVEAPEYHIKVCALVDLAWNEGDPRFNNFFMEEDEPLELRFRPAKDAVETDIRRLTWDHFRSIGEFVDRLKFVAEVLSDPSIQADWT